MKLASVCLALFSFSLLLAGCAAGDHPLMMESAALSPAPLNASARVQADASAPGRMLIWHARYTLEVEEPAAAADQVAELARQAGGFVEMRSGGDEDQARLSLRVPAQELQSALDALEGVGKVTDREVSSRDVTEQYVDLDARLRTKIALRDRLRQLLDRADDVQDILAIEKELSRIQADIDAMQAHLNSLARQVELVSVEVTLKRRTVLGPLGVVGKGAFWVVEKLFVFKN